MDPDTGEVQVRRWVVAHDCGRALHPTLVDGQIHRGVVQGLPDALNEQLAHDAAGQRLTATLMDYALARADEAPAFEIRHLESPTPLNPPGAKGAGEGGIMPVQPAGEPGDGAPTRGLPGRDAGHRVPARRWPQPADLRVDRAALDLLRAGNHYLGSP